MVWGDTAMWSADVSGGGLQLLRVLLLLMDTTIFYTKRAFVVTATSTERLLLQVLS